MLSFVPIVIEDITTTGSPLLDGLGLLSVLLYDLVTGGGALSY